MRIAARALFWIALVTASFGFAQNPSPLPPLDPTQVKAIDSFVSAERVREKIPGLALGIYSRGTVLLAKGYGLASVELNVPVKPETVFQSGSIGKQFVSAAMMMLVEEGKVSLDDSITKYFPDAPGTWKPILIKNLLSHTSGLAEYETPERTGPKGPFYLRLDFSEGELAKKIESMPIEWAPGSKWAYRNTNYVLLGIIIHKVTGMFYGDFLKARIFKPLGMNSTRIISEADIIPNRAQGYELHGGEVKNQSWVSPTFDSTADGALYFNVLDLAKWDAALYTTQLLKQSSLDRIWTVYPLNNGKPNPAGYGFGWFIGQQKGHRRIEHGGAWQGFTAQISRYPDDRLTVVVLTNLDEDHSNPGLIAHLVAGLVNPALLARLTAIPDEEPAIAGTLKEVLNEIAAGRTPQLRLTNPFAPEMTAKVLEGMRERLAPLWPGGTLTLVKRERGDDGQPVSTFRIRKGGEANLIIFSIDGSGKSARFEMAADREFD
jgi:CubicO group peptidase (beta-lactamase class C family)